MKRSIDAQSKVPIEQKLKIRFKGEYQHHLPVSFLLSLVDPSEQSQLKTFSSLNGLTSQGNGVGSIQEN